VLEQFARTGKPLLIIAKDIEKEALHPWLVNACAVVLLVVPSRPPASVIAARPCIEDIAVLPMVS